MRVWVKPELHKMWAAFSSSAPYLLHRGLTIRPIKRRYLLKVLRSVRKPVTNLNCVLFKDSKLFFAVDLKPRTYFRACLSVLTRPRHVIKHIGYLSSVCCTDRRIRLKTLSLISINDKRNTGMDHYWNGTNKGKPNYSEKNLSQCFCFHYTLHAYWPGIEAETLQCVLICCSYLYHQLKVLYLLHYVA
jgi:hypothetical protein